MQALIASLGFANLEQLSDDTPTREVIDKAFDGVFTEWFGTVSGQELLASGCAATHGWLLKHNREKDAEHLMREAKLMFALMNNPTQIFEILEAVHEGDEVVVIRLEDAWKSACERANRDPVTGRKR